MQERHPIRSKWYVIQVRTTMEKSMCRQIERACEEHDKECEGEANRVDLKECFSPTYKTQRKWKGQWQDVERQLLPGYVLADTAHPAQLVDAIRGIRDLCRLVTGEETYEPLNETEHVWIERWTGKGNRVIPMSFGKKVGDKIEITEGPLKGYEGEIVNVNRAKNMAQLEFHVGSMTIKTKVGLGILPG